MAPQGCLENSDLENSDPRPEKLRPLGVPKNKTLFTMRERRMLICLLFVHTVALPKSAEKRKTAHSVRYVQ